MKKENPYAYILTLLSFEERRINVRDNVIPHLEHGSFEIYPAINAWTNELEAFCEKHPEVSRIKLTDVEDEDIRTRMALIYAFYRILEDAQRKNRVCPLFSNSVTVRLDKQVHSPCHGAGKLAQSLLPGSYKNWQTECSIGGA